MPRLSFNLVLAIAFVLPCAASAAEPQRHGPATLVAAQREAMRPLAFLDGAWRGEARTIAPDGSVHAITQTERVGPFLDGSLKLIEGRGYDAGGSVVFDALGIVSWDADRRRYGLRSHAMGRAGDFAFAPTTDGFTWEIPAGPATIRYTATVRDGTWREVGERLVEGQPPVRFFEMTLKRIGDSDWPAGGAIPPR